MYWGSTKHMAKDNLNHIYTQSELCYNPMQIAFMDDCVCVLRVFNTDRAVMLDVRVFN